ncbi:hypothetical protein Hanom_Chr03g00225731 [Helianthus anomalus]
MIAPLTMFSILISFPAVIQVSGSEKNMPLGSKGARAGVIFQISNGSGIKVASPMLETTMWPGTGNSAIKSCKVTEGLCGRDCLTGCCNERCSKRFTNGTGKCLEPMLPNAPCLCHYTFFGLSRFPAARGDLLMDYHILNYTKRKKSFFINFLPNTQNRFFAISKHNNQTIRLKTQSQTPS